MLMLAQNLGMVPAFSENVRRARACDEDDRPYAAVPPRPHPELLQGEEDHSSGIIEGLTDKFY